jgi:hypothetical protein
MKPEDKAVVQQALDAFTSSWSTEQEMFKVHDAHMKAIAALHQLLEQPEPVAWHDKIMGMEVSMDVSTGDDDIDHRVYGTVYEVIFQDDGGTPDVILAIETERNFTTPPEQPTGDNLTPLEAQSADHADELTIAYMSGVHTGKKIAKRDLLEALERLLVVQDELCSIDHHGYCQSHYLDNVNSHGGCRVANARALVAKVRGKP